jgi:DNA (cytosine-5-)-methyltransferase
MNIKKQELTSASHCDFTLEALRQIAPSAFTEVRDEQGELTHKIDFEVLRELLGDKILDSDEERFGFYWVGKQDAKRAAAEPTRKTLRPIVKDSVDWDTTQNLYIEGDNLEVLKLLQRAYLGKVKMIYIDPPYNTGNDFVYDDDFAMSREEMDEAMGNLDEEGNRLRRNLDSNPRYHSDWCSMIYSRLLVARTLLSNDGVIFISIDDNEVHHLRKICDEVFGASNFVNQFCWRRRRTQANLSVNASTVHEYILCYAKDIAKIRLNRLPYTAEYIAQTFSNPDNDPKGAYQTGPLARPASSSNRAYTLTMPNGREITAKWSCSKETFQSYVKEGRLVIPRGGEGMPRIKIYLSELPGMIPNTWLDSSGTNDDANRTIQNIFDGASLFDYSKPKELVEHLLRLGSSSDSLILDFFSGSATTAHAVMQLNAEDGGKRKYICVQLPEQTPEESEARKAGYSTICEIGKERIRRAGKKIKEESEATDLDTGFRVLRVDTSNMEEVYFEPAALQQDHLFGQVNSVKEDRNDLDLLFGCMVDWGVELSHPLRQEEVAGKRLHIVNDGALVACFEEDIDLEVIRAIAKLEPLRVLFRESCFASDADKLNIYEQFKQFCGWSAEESYRRIHVM